MQLLTIVIISVSVISILAVIIFLYWQMKTRNETIQGMHYETIDMQQYVDKVCEREAKILSVRPRENHNTTSGGRVVKFRLAVKNAENKFDTRIVKWKIENFILSDFRQGKTINVKVYNDMVFPSMEGSMLVKEDEV